MSFARPAPATKINGNSTVVPPLPVLPKLPSRLQTKRTSILPSTTKTNNDSQISSAPNHNELDDIVNNLSTIVKKSEQLLTPVKPTLVSTSIRRTASLHLTKVELDRRKSTHPLVKSSLSHHQTLEKSYDQRSKLHDSMSDRSSECSTSVSSLTRRTSIRPTAKTEKYSGIKCTLPSFTSTVPTAFKGLEKHYTPVKNKLSTSSTSTSLMDHQITPANTNGRDKSPWRLRFEKFLNHQELTPLSPTRDSTTLNNSKNSSLGKENRTPSFRLPARRMSRCNLPS